jgi:hypothetical protein
MRCASRQTFPFSFNTAKGYAVWEIHPVINGSHPMKYWEIIADNLKNVDAHRGDGKRFVVRG